MEVKMEVKNKDKINQPFKKLVIFGINAGEKKFKSRNIISTEKVNTLTFENGIFINEFEKEILFTYMLEDREIRNVTLYKDKMLGFEFL